MPKKRPLKNEDLCSATPYRGRGGGEGMGLCTSVTATRMTDAYGAGTHQGRFFPLFYFNSWFIYL